MGSDGKRTVIEGLLPSMQTQTKMDLLIRHKKNQPLQEKISKRGIPKTTVSLKILQVVRAIVKMAMGPQAVKSPNVALEVPVGPALQSRFSQPSSASFSLFRQGSSSALPLQGFLGPIPPHPHLHPLEAREQLRDAETASAHALNKNRHLIILFLMRFYHSPPRQCSLKSKGESLAYFKYCEF